MPPTVFIDPIEWDFESLVGPPAHPTVLADLVATFKSSFPRFTATHHAITNHRVAVDRDRATIRAHIRVEHCLPSDLVESGPNCWLVVGFYDDAAVRTSDGWRLARVKLSVSYRENAHLHAVALGAATNTGWLRGRRHRRNVGALHQPDKLGQAPRNGLLIDPMTVSPNAGRVTGI